MAMEFDNNLPIYLQIMQHIKKQIVTGKLKAGDKDSFGSRACGGIAD